MRWAISWICAHKVPFIFISNELLLPCLPTQGMLLDLHGHKNKWIPRSVNFSTACLFPFPEFFSLAQSVTYRCKHLSGNTSEISMGCRCWWLVCLISEKCTEQSRIRRKPVAGRVYYWANSSQELEHTSILEVALEDWQAGRSSNQEKSLKSPKAKPDCQGHFSGCLFITPEESSWAFQPCSVSNTLPRVCNYEGWGGSGKSSVLSTHASFQEEDKPAEIYRIPPPSHGSGLAPPVPFFICETRIITILSFLNVVKIKLH